MARPRDSLIWGIILLIVGLLFLLWNFGVFASFQDTALLIIVAFFGLGGLGFLASYLFSRQDWWKVIPGFALLSVGSIIFLAPRDVDPIWMAALLFVGIALAFAVIYAGDRRERWWALIPFGTMIVMIITVLLSTTDWAPETLGAVLFGGMGLVFFLVYLLASERQEFRWALIPMSVLLVMALVSLAAAINQANPNLVQFVRLWPLSLVVMGVVLLGFAFRRPKQPAEPVTELPAEPTPSELPAAPGTSVSEVPEDFETMEVPAAVEGTIAPQLAEPSGGKPTPSGQAKGAQSGAFKEEPSARAAAGEEAKNSTDDAGR